MECLANVPYLTVISICIKLFNYVRMQAVSKKLLATTHQVYGIDQVVVGVVAKTSFNDIFVVYTFFLSQVQNIPRRLDLDLDPQTG